MVCTNFGVDWGSERGKWSQYNLKTHVVWKVVYKIKSDLTRGIKPALKHICTNHINYKNQDRST